MRRWIDIISQLVLPIATILSMECVGRDMRVSIVFFIILSVWIGKDMKLILATIIMAGCTLLILKIPYSWIPFSIATAAGLIHIWFLYQKKKENETNILNYAQEQANIFAERLNKEECSSCHAKHQVKLDATISKNRIIFRYSGTDDCPEIEEKVYQVICRLEHEVNKDID